MRKNLIISLGAAILTMPGAWGQSHDPIPPGMSRVVLEAHDPYGDGLSGFQWILDSGHDTYDNVFFDGIMYFGDYSHFDYMLPEDAEANGSTDKVLVDGTMELTLPAGTYDWMVIHPDGWSMTYVYGGYATMDDFPLLEGKTYRMLIEYGDGESGPGAYATLVADTDMAISLLKVPMSGVGLTDSEEISVTLSNLGTVDMSAVKVSYSVNGHSPVTETIPAAIKAGESLDYTFSKKADLSAIGKYELQVWVEAEGDMLPANNSASLSLRHLVARILPYNCNFSEMTPENFDDEWIVIDANGDGCGWMYNEYFQNKDGEMGTANCTGCFSGNMTGDDWLISPPLQMLAGKNNMSFTIRSLNDTATEVLEVCVGTSPYPEDMRRVASYETCSVDWLNKAATFEVESDGIYYVALHSMSQNGYNQFIGDISVNAGEYVGIPAVRINKTHLPVSNACLPNDCKIGVNIKNTGTSPLTDYTLTAYVNDRPYSKDFSEPLQPDETADLYIDELIDFSKAGKYDIQFLVQNDIVDAIVSSTVECFEPLDELPIVSNFTNDINSGIWYSLTPGAWHYEGMFMIFDSEAHGLDNGLLCQGFNVDHSIRVKLSYMAHGWGTTGLGVYLGKAGSDISSFKRVFYDDNVVSKEDEAEFTAEISEPGCYSLIIVDESEIADNSTYLRLNEITISEILPYDVRISDVVSPTSAYMPASQLGGSGKYAVSVENRGSETMDGIIVTAFIDGEEYASSGQTLTLAPGEMEVSEVVMTLPEKEAGDSFVLSFKAQGSKADEYAEDNVHELPVIHVTDEVRAYENISTPEYGTGSNGSPLAVGNVFTFNEEADITSMLVGFAMTTSDNPSAGGDVAFNIYRLNDDYSLDYLIYSSAQVRGEGGMTEIDFDDMRLSPGSYYFEVEQRSIYNMGLAYDPETTGTCYMRTDEGLVKSENYALCIRAMFGNEPTVFAKDAASIKITSPAYTSGLYGEQTKVTVKVRNNGYIGADIDVSLLLDGAEINSQSVTLRPYEEQEVAFDNVDLSAPGTHNLEARAGITSDENPLNDSCFLTLEAAEEESPYVMDFESCNDFDASSEIFNPRWKTIDRNGVNTTYFWRYEHPHRGEPCGFMAFNPDETVPSMTELEFKGMYAHSGSRFGLAFTFDPWSEGAEGIEQSDVWIVSPKLTLGTDSKFEAYVKTRDLETYDAILEPFRILISDTDDSPENFVTLGDDVRLAPVEDWELVSVDLSDYDGKDVYVALQYIGKPIVNTCLMIDDLHVNTNNVTTVASSVADRQVMVVGNNIMAPEGSRVYSISGMDCGTENLEKGIYVVKTPFSTVKVIIR